jgi:putative heme-binding domain-containing protein
MATDAQGRTVVAGPGYVRWLKDTNADGRADTAVELVKGIKQMPMGLLWEGDTLWVMADGGLRKYSGVTGAAPVAQSELVLPLKTGSEHLAHAIHRGPDGWLYILGGDNSGFGPQHATSPLSPIKTPTGGCLVRLTPDLQYSEIVGHGFRNPYAFDFSLDGKPFTFDSDNERCISLPWYEGCRFYEIKPGAHHGWLSPQFATTFRRPPYYPDTAQPIHDLGRGSPTGVVCYRHTRFPEPYQGAFFLGDWTHGRIWVVTPEGGRKPEVFAQVIGDAGFAVSGLSMDSTTGELLACVGGRGSRGAVFRISCAGTGQPLPMRKLDKAAYAEVGKDSGPEWLRKLRAFHLQHGDLGAKTARGTVFEGYSFQALKTTIDEKPWLTDFATGDATVKREIARVFAAGEFQDPQAVALVLGQLTRESHPVDDIHYLIVLSRLKAARTMTQTQATAQALVALDAKMDARKLETDRNWPLRVSETVAELHRKDPNLLTTMVKQTAGFGRPKHLLFAQVSGFDKTLAADQFLAQAKRQAEYEWTAELVRFVGALPEDRWAALIPSWWERGGLEDAVLSAITRVPKSDHRAKYAYGLKSTSPRTVAACVTALGALKGEWADSETAATIVALRKLPDTTEGKTAGQTVADVLNRVHGQTLTADAKEWERWAANTKPAVAALLTANAGYNREAWTKRLESVNWEAGDAARGKAVFAKAQCAACHDGGRAVGPALGGVAQRFNKDDLLVAILDPARDVSPRYRPTRITTTDGKVYEGLVIYDATDAVLLLTGADTTAKVDGSKIETKKPSSGTIMPSGLLDPLKNEEVADLIAYLKSLKAK